jgi:glucose/arabinose dehydrogenase/plastocyanin
LNDILIIDKFMHLKTLPILFFVFVLLLFTSSSSSPFYNLSHAAYIKAPPLPNGPGVNDPNLIVQKINDKTLDFPTSMAFLGNNDILVTEKTTGKVIRITDGQVQDDIPVLDVQVASDIERGLLGIAVSNSKGDGKTYVFLYYTESGGGEDGDDFDNGIDPIGNRLYRYEFTEGKLINPTLLLDLPAIPENGRGEHNGGKIVIGPDNNIYTTIGDVGGHRTQAQNTADGPEADGTGGILRITQDGNVVGNPIFGEEDPLRFYYAMGVRNSFGIDFDPVTGTLWATENGPTTGDEINIVEPGFNSGWAQIQGFANRNLLGQGMGTQDLVTLGNSKYRDPLFAWDTTIGITDAKFLNSNKLGKQYENNLFVGDINNGILYRFTPNSERNSIELNGTIYSGNLQELADKEVNNAREVTPVVFGQGFGGITDIDVGPDGYLYVLTYFGDLYRILPKSNSVSSPVNNQQANESSLPPTSSQPDSMVAQIVGVNGERSYNPNPITISRGQAIQWVNGDAISHTVTSVSANDDNDASDNGASVGSDGSFDSEAILPGQPYILQFNESGIYDYYCFYHPSMVGQVIVDDSGGDDSGGDDSGGDDSGGDDSGGDDSGGDDSGGE